MKLIMLLGIFLLSGCGSTSNVRVDSPITETSSFKVYDARSDNQKAGLSDNPSNDTKYYSDKMLNPTPSILIKSALHAKLNEALASKTVILKSFQVSVYDGSLYGRSKFSVKPSEIPIAVFFAPLIAMAAISSSVDGINAEQLVNVEVEVDINNTYLYGGSSNQYKGHVSDENVSETINQALDNLVANIQSKLPEVLNAP